MQSISNADILDMLLFVEERINTTIERGGSVISVNDFLASPDKMDIFDATCMRLQTIGETVKNIDNLTISDYKQIESMSDDSFYISESAEDMLLSSLNSDENSQNIDDKRKKEWKNHCHYHDDFPFRYDFIRYLTINYYIISVQRRTINL